MEYKENIRNRHSTRAFLDQQVRIKDIEEILQDARKAPTWLNAQERKIYVAAGNTAKTIRKEYYERAKNDMIGISDFTAVHRTEWSEVAQKNMADHVKRYEEFLGDENEKFLRSQDILFNAPAFVYLALPKDAPKWAILDLGAFEEEILMGATDRGIASIVAYAIIKYPDIIRKHLPIPDNEDIVIGIGLGYEDGNDKINQYRSTRRSLSDILIIKK